MALKGHQCLELSIQMMKPWITQNFTIGICNIMYDRLWWPSDNCNGAESRSYVVPARPFCSFLGETFHSNGVFLHLGPGCWKAHLL